jgi:hypothetical protein
MTEELQNGPIKNKPLTTEQKLILANIQRKRLNVQIMINSLDQQLQQELTKISQENNIDILNFALNDDFEIIPKEQVKEQSKS